MQVCISAESLVGASDRIAAWQPPKHRKLVGAALARTQALGDSHEMLKMLAGGGRPDGSLPNCSSPLAEFKRLMVIMLAGGEQPGKPGDSLTVDCIVALSDLQRSATAVECEGAHYAAHMDCSAAQYW